MVAMIKYGQKIIWTPFFGIRKKVKCSGYDSLMEAQMKCIEMAKERGWTPKKWWQIWRIRDTKIDENPFNRIR